jgi:DNA-binding MarR family transcriptional regulator
MFCIGFAFQSLPFGEVWRGNVCIYNNYYYLCHMKLEEEIKQQKGFDSEHDRAVVNILYTSSWLYNLNAARLKEYDVTPEQFNVLRILRGSYPKPMMLNDISGRMLDKSSNATRLVEKLRQKGLVKREICPNNRRQVDIMITEAGLGTLTAIDNGCQEWMNSIKGLTEPEVHELNRILDKMRDQPA